MYVCVCVQATRNARLTALTLVGRKWLIKKSNPDRLSPAEYFPLWELRQLNREEYRKISVELLLIFHKRTA